MAKPFHMLKVYREKNFYGIKLGVFLQSDTVEAYWCYKPEYEKSVGSMHMIYTDDTFQEIRLKNKKGTNEWRKNFSLESVPKPNVLTAIEFYIKYKVKGEEQWRYYSAGGENYYSVIGYRYLDMSNFSEDTFIII